MGRASGKGREVVLCLCAFVWAVASRLWVGAKVHLQDAGGAAALIRLC